MHLPTIVDYQTGFEIAVSSTICLTRVRREKSNMVTFANDYMNYLGPFARGICLGDDT
jgi:hypothetical protein